MLIYVYLLIVNYAFDELYLVQQLHSNLAKRSRLIALARLGILGASFFALWTSFISFSRTSKFRDRRFIRRGEGPGGETDLIR